MTAAGSSSAMVVCTYRVRFGEEEAFERLLARHTTTLHRLGLITDHPVQALRQTGVDLPTYVEIFEWVSHDAAARAAEVPDVIEIWEPMATLCEERDGRGAIEFPLFDPVRPDG